MSYDSEIQKYGKNRINIELFKKIRKIPYAGRTELEKAYTSNENIERVERVENDIVENVEIMVSATDMGSYTMLSIYNWLGFYFKYFSGTLLLTSNGRPIYSVEIEETDWLDNQLYIDLRPGIFEYEQYDSYAMDADKVTFEVYTLKEIEDLKEQGIIEKNNIDIFFEYMTKLGYSKDELSTLSLSNLITAEGKEVADLISKAAEMNDDRLKSILANSSTEFKLEYKISDEFKSFDEDPPIRPVKEAYPEEPRYTDPKYQLKGFARLFKNNDLEQAKMERLFNTDHEEWENTVEDIERRYSEALELYQTKYNAWKDKEREFEEKKKQIEKNLEIIKSGAKKGEPEYVEDTCELILEQLKLPFDFKYKGAFKYLPESNTLVAEVYLPAREDIPRLKAVKYNASLNEYSEITHSDSYIDNLYEIIIYQLVLVLIRQFLSSTDVLPAFESIIFNGKVATVEKATGKTVEPCILSVSTDRTSAMDIVPNHVDAKEWFKKLNGISAAKLSNVVPIPPIAMIDKNDNRFVEAYGVADNLDDSVNLAAMDWKDFENLIREIFEKEFSSNGGEVKVTQASRDGGVDAVAFDPDPIKGGKIVIQAKRYTNIVGVSAVRDLYGTVLNEGANKGILVTTSGYGPDAYEFANGKPITLLDGGNLMYLLEKYGYKAKIDIDEARRLNKS